MGKSILITGCSSGIGYTTAFALQSRGYNVIASARSDNDVTKLKSEGLNTVIPLDLACSDSIFQAVSTVESLLDGEPLDALFNNGAYGLPGAVEDLTRDGLRRQFEVNVFGTQELTNQLLPLLMKSQSGRIIQNSSVVGLSAIPMRGAYNATKYALEALSDTLRMELNDTRVRVSLIEPGPIATCFRQNALAAMEKEIDYEKSRHKGRYEQALARLRKESPSSRFTLPSDAVTKKVIHALEASNPKTRYFVTFPTYLVAALRIILPTRMMDRFLLKVAGA